MARAGITRDQVHEAAEALSTEGATPTVVGIRTRLGGGSPNNITKWLSEWREAHAARTVTDLPALPEAVESAMRQVWGLAWKGAQTQLEIEREALGTARQAIERERAELLAEISRLDAALEDAQGEAQRSAQALAEEHQAHEQTRAAAREAQALATERQQQIDRLAQELRTAQQQATDRSAQTGRLEAEVSRAHADLEQARRLVGELRQTHHGALNENQRLQAELESQRETTKQAKAAVDLSGKKIQKLEQVLDEERRARTAAESALTEGRVELATLRERATRTEELRTVLETLRQRP